MGVVTGRALNLIRFSFDLARKQTQTEERVFLALGWCDSGLCEAGECQRAISDLPDISASHAKRSMERYDWTTRK